jgi:hypothetical protein
MTNELDLNADIIDVRDIIARFEELSSDIEVGEPDEDMRKEHSDLLDILDELRDVGGGDEQWRGDWYPVTLIRDSYFTEAMDELLEDIGDLPKNLPSYLQITVDYVALKMDYTAVQINGTTYYTR